MELILLIVVVALGFAVQETRKAIKALQDRVMVLERAERLYGAAGPSAASDAASADSMPLPEAEQADAYAAEAAAFEPQDELFNATQQSGPWANQSRDETAGQSASRKREPWRPNWEHLLGVRLPVWGGAALMVFAAFLFANYAMEQGFFTPVVRVWASGLGALALLAAAFFVRWRKIANGERIASALAAAGIAAGFATFFLATAVFALIPPVWGMVGASVVALGAIGIAILFGRSVLILGLLGGYLSPALLDALPDQWVLLPYLLAVLIPSHAVAAKKGWWNSAMVSSLFGLLFAAAWAFDVHGWNGTGSSAALAIWLVALAAVPALADMLVGDEAAPIGARRDGLVVAALGSALVLVATAVEAGTALPYWPAFFAWLFVLTAVSVVHPRRQDLAGVAMVGFVAALVFWREPDPVTRLWVLVPSLALLLGAAASHIAAARRPGFWAGAAMAVLMVAILSSLVDFDGWAGARDVPYLWAVACLSIAAALIGIIAALRNHALSEPVTPPLAVGVSGLISVAIGLLVDPGYYALSAALQIAGLGLVFWRYGGKVLPRLALVYLTAYLVLMGLGHAIAIEVPNIAATLPYGAFIPVAAVDAMPIPTLILPGLALLAGATLFGLRGVRLPVRVLDLVGILVLALGFHLVIAPMAESDPIRLVFVFGALWFPLQFGISAAALYGAARFDRHGLQWGGSIIAVLASLALVQLAIFPIGAFWPVIEVPGVFIANLATVTLGFSAILLLLIGKLIKRDDTPWRQWAGAAFQALGGISLFVLILVTIRHGFHPDLLQGPTSGLERYAYTGGMLAFSFALLWLGTARDTQIIRIASLVVALATVAKLFVFDMVDLEGLWRIGSFLGLGIALLAVSWFYARFVFAIGTDNKTRGSGDSEAGVAS